MIFSHNFDPDTTNFVKFVNKKISNEKNSSSDQEQE